MERSARRVEDTCGWRTCRAGRGAHSAHRPVNTGKGGLSTEREQGRVRSDSTPGEATGQARAWRIYAHLLARAATMSHLSMAGGVPRGPLLAWLQISPGRAGSVHTFGQKPYQRESIYKDMPGKPRSVQAIIRKGCRAECERSPGFTRMKMSRPASRAGRTHEDAHTESSTCFHTAPLRACGEPIVDVRSGGEGGHEGPERAQILLPVKNGDPVKQG